MKRILVATAAIAALIGPPALAADMPVKAPPPMPAPVYNWTGFYVGVNGGYGWNNTSGDFTCVGPDCVIPPTNPIKPEGGLLGGQAGYNLQNGLIVYGIEADIQGSQIKDSSAIFGQWPLVGGGLSGPGTFSSSQNLTWFDTLRGRLGWAGWDRVLVYGTAGLFYGHEDVAFSRSFTASPVFYSANDSSARVGWTAGGGIDWAFAPNYIARIEALYYDMGSETIVATSPLNRSYTFPATFKYQGALVRLGLSHKF